MQRSILRFWQNSACFFVLLLSSIIFSGCVVENESATPTGQEVYELFITEGLTCEVQMSILSLSDDQYSVLRELLVENLKNEEITTIAENREYNCSIPENNNQNTDSLGRLTQAVTGTYTVEFIEETTGSGGYYPTYVFRDSSNYGWMCDDGESEWPADWIIQYYVPNSYSNLSDLRIRGTNSFASCYIGNPTAARVYSDDDIRGCFGYWTVWSCTLGTGPTTYESVIWIQ